MENSHQLTTVQLSSLVMSLLLRTPVEFQPGIVMQIFPEKAQLLHA